MPGDKPFFGGATPSALDATVYAFLANRQFVEINSPVRNHLRHQARLVACCKRMAALVGR